MVPMQTMGYGPLKLCGTESMVWAVDGTLAIGYSLFILWLRMIMGGIKNIQLITYTA